MVKKEGIIAVAGLAVSQYLQDFGKEGGAISPEVLTQITQMVPLPILFLGGLFLYLYKKDGVQDSGPPICPICNKKFELEQD